MQQGKGQEERVTDNFENCPLGTVKNPDRVSRQSGPVIAELSDFPTKSWMDGWTSSFVSKNCFTPSSEVDLT